MTNWQMIDTAPKDGRPLLLKGGFFWCEKRGEKITDPCVARWYEGCWLICGLESGYIWVMYDSPTQWMELPT